MSKEAPKFWIYIAGPYSKPNPLINTREACQRYEHLRREFPDALVICPHWSMIQEMMGPKSHQYWMDHDLALISALHASGIPGCISRIHGESTGADMEADLAKRLGISVFTELYSVFLWAKSILEASE